MARVLVFVNEFTSTSIPVEIAAKIDVETQTEIVLVSYFDEPDDELDPNVRQLDIPMVCLGATSRTDFHAYRELRQLCDHRDIDVVQTHHNSVGSLGRLALAGEDVKIVNTEHNDHRYFSHLQKVANTVTYPLTDVMVHNSHSTRNSLEWYETALSSGSEHNVIYNGVDIPRIDNAGEPPVSLPSGPILTTVGRLVEQKNHASLLRAFEQIVDQHPETTLVIVGDGPLSVNLKSQTRNIGIQDSVVFTGYLPRREDVYGVLKESTVAAFPSWYEGFCVAAVEAMAAGLPVVVSDIDVLREVVGNPGVFANPNDPKDFADAINNLLQQPERRKRLGKRSKNRARLKFSLEQTAREYSNIYEQAAEALK